MSPFHDPVRPCPDCGETFQSPGDRCHRCYLVVQRTRRWCAAVPRRYQWATDHADDLLERRADPSAVSRSRSIAWQTFALLGPSGAGKTSLAVAMVSRWMRSREHPRWAADFVSTVDAEHAARRHRLGDNEPRDIERALEADVLVFDDLGMEQSRWGIEAVIRIVSHRHDADAITVATTGLDVAQLETRYGSGIARRLLEPGVLRLDRRR